MRQFFVLISNILLPFLQLLVMHKCMITFLGPDKRTYKGIISWFLYYLFLFTTDTIIHISPRAMLVVNMMMVFIISSFTTRKSLKKRCIFTILIISVWMLVEVLVVHILSLLGAEIRTIFEAGNFISKICMLLFSVAFSHYMKQKNSSEISFRYFLIILLVPVSSIYIMHNIFIISALHNEFALFSTITGFLLLLVNYVVFEIYDWMSRDAEIREQNRLYSQQLELCSRQAEERESLYLELRRLRHDLKNYLTGLLGVVHTGIMEDAEKMIQSMLDSSLSERISEVSRSGNIVVDSLVNHKYTLATKYRIRFEASVFIPISLPFQSGHLAVILGNLLENALEACQKVPEQQRYITLEISYVKEVLQICIRNSYIGERRKDNSGRFRTTKENATHHGIGLSSVEQAVSYYHGELKTKETENEFQATVVMYGLCGEK